MGRTRLLKYGLFLDEDLAQVTPEARLLFAGLPTIADREGRIEDRPLKIKALLFPYDSWNLDELLCQLAAPRHVSVGSFIYRYEVDGKRYIQIANFSKHQNPHPKEKPSVIPEMPARVDTESCKATESRDKKCNPVKFPSGSVILDPDPNKKKKTPSGGRKAPAPENPYPFTIFWNRKAQRIKTDDGDRIVKHFSDWADTNARNGLQIRELLKQAQPGFERHAVEHEYTKVSPARLTILFAKWVEKDIMTRRGPPRDKQSRTDEAFEHARKWAKEQDEKEKQIDDGTGD
jgi:hypothetical protein